MFESHSKRKSEFMQHIKEAANLARSEKRNTLADMFENFYDKIEDVRYTISIIGHTNRGKSTLLNTMFGRTNDHISPVQSSSCTAGIIHYKDMKSGGYTKETAIVYFNSRSL